MKFMDELYAYYKDKLTADDEDIDLLVGSILQEFSREDMLHLLSELSDNELFKITGTYMAETLREKIIKDRQTNWDDSDKPSYYH